MVSYNGGSQRTLPVNRIKPEPESHHEQEPLNIIGTGGIIKVHNKLFHFKLLTLITLTRTQKRVSTFPRKNQKSIKTSHNISKSCNFSITHKFVLLLKEAYFSPGKGLLVVFMFNLV